MIYSDVDYGSGDKGLVRHSGSRGERESGFSSHQKHGGMAW